MKSRRIFIAILICACFHKPVIGLLAKWTISSQTGCQMAYEKIEWKGGKLVFSGLVLSDATFHARIKKSYLHFSFQWFPTSLKVHVLFDQPHVSLMEHRASWPESKKNWLEFSLLVNNGTLDYNGIAHFELDEKELVIDWGDAKLLFLFSRNGMEANLDRLNAGLLSPFIPWILDAKIETGKLSGRISLGPDRQLLSSHLKIEDLSMISSEARIDCLKGSLTYHQKLGAKWEIQGEASVLGRTFPIASEGRGFFSSGWLDLKWEFADASGKVSVQDGLWTADWENLRLSLVQPFVSLFEPKLSQWILDEEYISRGELNQEGGAVEIQGKELNFTAKGGWTDWKANLAFKDSHLTLHGGFDGEKCPIEIEKGEFRDFEFFGKGWVDSQLDGFFELRGRWSVTDWPFYCPVLEKKGNRWSFDFRFEREAQAFCSEDRMQNGSYPQSRDNLLKDMDQRGTPPRLDEKLFSKSTWDLARLCGTTDGNMITFYERSHLFGTPLKCINSEVNCLDVEFRLPWKTILGVVPDLTQFARVPICGSADVHFHYTDGQSILAIEGVDLRWKKNPIPMHFYAKQEGETWIIDHLECGDFSLRGKYQPGGIAKGEARWKDALMAEFDGKILPSFRCDFSLPKVHINLKDWGVYDLEGILEGQGHFVFDGQFESDFDLRASELKIQSYPFESESPIHLFYSPAKGTMIHGLNLHGPFTCKAELLEISENTFALHDAQVHFPGAFLSAFQVFEEGLDLSFSGDLISTTDRSHIWCSFQEAAVPFLGKVRHLKNVLLSWKDHKCDTSFYFQDALYRHHLDLSEKIRGRLSIGEEEKPLTFCWDYDGAISVSSIEGSFSGVDASFYATDPSTLLGNVSVDFARISPHIPNVVADIFEELKMGKGFDLKGEFKIQKDIPTFHGILSGKNCELFGFELQTLFAQVDWALDRIQISDLSVSDKAAHMEVREILMEGIGNNPWTIVIPELTISELRPSLLRRPGKTLSPLTPLLVRKLKISDFKGLLDERVTWTAQGNLDFLNSFKRGRTIFDLPAHFFSRIIGLDFDLMIPVCGELNFELKEGHFRLTHLERAFSEAGRSEFFLVQDPPPTMDLDGNLQIYVQMKQFVLFKLTEAFMISIDGVLDDPKFHLQKKSRFFTFL